MMSGHVNKPRVAFYDFASCEGCQIELTNYGDDVFLNLLQHIDLVECRETMSEKTTMAVDIACIEGSFTREKDRQRLLDIREKSAIVIAYGQCAVSGGINSLKNHIPDYAQCVYAEHSRDKQLQSQSALPISDVIKVDYAVYGCPINRNEFLQILFHLLHLKQPVIPDYPVCVECKRHETPCRIEFQADAYCLGMVARAGCDAPCPAAGIPCDACRGLVSDANLRAAMQLLKKKTGGQSERALNIFRLFNAQIIDKPLM